MKKLLFLWILGLFSLTVMAQNETAVQRVGCICKDGVRQDNTGAGACAKHGGVKYWLYADVEICKQYANNLPAIPDTELIELTPDAAKRLAKDIMETLPALPEDIKTKRETEKEQLKEELRREIKNEYAQQQPLLHQATATSYFNAIDFFVPFVMVLVVVLLFLLIVMVIKKVM